jgi:hypothetical protein
MENCCGKRDIFPLGQQKTAGEITAHFPQQIKRE